MHLYPRRRNVAAQVVKEYATSPMEENTEKKYACVCAAETSTSSLIEGLKEEGFQMKQSMLGRFMASSTQEVGTENGVPEVQD